MHMQNMEATMGVKLSTVARIRAQATKAKTAIGSLLPN